MIVIIKKWVCPGVSIIRVGYLGLDIDIQRWALLMTYVQAHVI